MLNVPPRNWFSTFTAASEKTLRLKHNALEKWNAIGFAHFVRLIAADEAGEGALEKVSSNKNPFLEMIEHKSSVRRDRLNISPIMHS